MYQTYEEIYKRYLLEAKNIAKGRVLKTDCHNESWIYEVSIPIAPELDNCYCLEINPDVIKLAKENFPKLDIRQWDICNIPFEDKFFDTIIDLSTIDHVHPKDIHLVMKEYKRVNKWELLLVVRTTNGDMDMEQEYNTQYYFNKERLEKQFPFEITYQEDLFQLENNVLVLYKLK